MTVVLNLEWKMLLSQDQTLNMVSADFWYIILRIKNSKSETLASGS